MSDEFNKARDEFNKAPVMEEEEEIPDMKISPARQQEIYNEFKISVRNQNFEKVQELLSKCALLALGQTSTRRN